MKIQTACFIGHRNFEISDEKYEKLKKFLEELIVNKNVHVFLFGSRSNFDYICQKAVAKLKNKYGFIQRKCYTCRSESCTLESERKHWEEFYSKFGCKDVHLLGVEEEVEHKTKWTAGRASYVERNQAMIKDSDICVFYYNENYKPPKRKNTKCCSTTYQPHSGTALAYNYAKQKKKRIINIYTKL